MIRVIEGDALACLRAMPEGTFQTCVTSPPYFGLRDYGVEGQMGLEESPDAFIAAMVEVFREVRRVLRPDGTLWLNIGDSFARNPSKGGSGPGGKNDKTYGDAYGGAQQSLARHGSSDGGTGRRPGTKHRGAGDGIKEKDLMMIPAMLAIALRSDGWYLRQDIIWSKPNPMPESATDRPTSAHEHVFLLTKSPRYFYDAEAIKEEAITAEWPGAAGEGDAGAWWGTKEVERPGDRPPSPAMQRAMKVPSGWDTEPGQHLTIKRGAPRRGAAKGSFGGKGSAAPGGHEAFRAVVTKRNSRNVWTIPSQPYSGAHFATMPPNLAERCIKAGTSERGQCPACGAAWIRKTDRGDKQPVVEGSSLDRFGTGKHGVHRKIGGQYQKWLDENPTRTIGWVRTCSCPAQPPDPQWVLDPFGGAGTTALVSDRLGRHATICEISPEYAAQARARLAGDAPLLVDVL